MSSNLKQTLGDLFLILSNRTCIELITPSDENYETARLIYNRMHDCRPGLIVRTMDIDTLRLIITFAFQNDIVLAIRGGGHHIGGFGTCHDGIVIDFSPFKNIQVDTKNNLATVDPGVRLSDLDSTLTAAGYVVPTGTISDTGIAGLTLGGGIGWLVGQYGLTCDQLCGADVLLADGRLVRAEDPEHQDLLWALRGGGGNFGIVMQFRYRLNPLPRTVCGMGIIDWQHVMPVMTALIQYLDTCPASMTIAPIFTKDSMGELNLRIDFCCANGTQEDVERLIALSNFIKWSDVRAWDFAAWQKEFDFSLLPPMRGYWKAVYLDQISTNIVKILMESFERSPVQRCTIMIEHLHGAFKDYDQTSSAFPLRASNFGIVIAARWVEPEQDSSSIHWVRESFRAIDPQESSQAYLNYTTADDQRAVQTLMLNAPLQMLKVKSHYDS